MRWIDYLARFDFDIRYIKVADVLSRYYEHNYWTSMPELHDYIDADVRLDPEHDDLPRKQVFKIEEKVIELGVQRLNSAKI